MAYFLRDLLELIYQESQRLYVTGPESEQARRRFTAAIGEANDILSEYRRLAASEERIGG